MFSTTDVYLYSTSCVKSFILPYLARPALPGSLWLVYLNDVSIGPALVRLVVLCVFEQDLVHVGAGVLEQLVGAVEDDQGDLAVAQHAQLVRLLHQAKLSLCKRNLNEGHREKAVLQR